jgi:hypothetical protein
MPDLVLDKAGVYGIINVGKVLPTDGWPGLYYFKK